MKLFRRVLLALAVLIVVLNWTWGRLPAEPDPPATAKYATVDGVKIHYQETPGRGPGVIMVHGHPGTFLDWAYVQSKLPGMRTVAIDRPGFGYSSGGYVAFDDQVKIVHDLAAKLGMKKPIIAGHSYGGTIALAYGLRYPKQTTGIVPVDPAVNPDALSSFDMIQAQFVKALQLPVVRPLANATFNQLVLTASSKPQVDEAFSPDPANPDYTEQLKSVNLKSSDLETFADETLAYNKDTSAAAARFGTITTPAWIIQGKGDKLVSPSDVTKTAGEMKNAKLILLPGGHMQTWVHPAQVATAIRQAAG
ncbi:MAG: alpha/beta hydrolase [Solirubrobacterales bacterium]